MVSESGLAFQLATHCHCAPVQVTLVREKSMNSANPENLGNLHCFSCQGIVLNQVCELIFEGFQSFKDISIPLLHLQRAGNAL